jgi:alkylation response protein AidB-like acyl-CoA dehydrogenase
VNDQRVAEFRLEFRTWIDENLPSDWTDISRGTDETRAVGIRQAWGARLYEGGWAAPHWPVEYGGRGLTIELQIVVFEELARAGAPEALNSNGIGIFGPILIRHGTLAQRRRYLSPMLDHSELWCQGFSEPNAGSDLASLRTRARLDGDRFIVNGQKLWTSFAGQSAFCYLMVRTDPDAPKHAGLSFLILDMRSPGVSIRPLKNVAGGQEFAEVFLDDVEVPAENLVGEMNQGWKIATEALGLERGLSFAERALRLKREVSNLLGVVERITDGRPASLSPTCRSRIVDSYIGAQAMHSLVLRVLLLIDDPQAMAPLASLAKLSWSEQHQKLLGLTLDVVGDRAGTEEYRELLGAFLFTRGESIYGGTSEVQRNGIARFLGLPSSATVNGNRNGATTTTLRGSPT